MDRNKQYLSLKTPFNKPHITNKELHYINDAHLRGQLAGDGYYTKLCHSWIEKQFDVRKVLLTHSCSAALDMMGILTNIQPGDEVIMPSYTFSSTANAIVLRGGVPVFIDIRSDTLNIDESLIESAITKKTKAVMVVHYAGVGCDMDSIKAIAKKHNLFVLEDAAQGFLAKYKGKYLGTIGDLGAYSFHETKNIISGEGGCLLVNNELFSDHAEIVREKGTNRSKFYRGEVDKYTWVDVGSSYLPGEITAAFLYSQLEDSKKITNHRLRLWNRYKLLLSELEKKGYLRLPFIPEECQHNAHIFYILLGNIDIRQKLIDYLKKNNILAIFHYVPLHSSPAGVKYGRTGSVMVTTDNVGNTLLRLPLYYDLRLQDVERISMSIIRFFEEGTYER